MGCGWRERQDVGGSKVEMRCGWGGITGASVSSPVLIFPISPPPQGTTHPLPYLKQVAFLHDNHSVPSPTYMDRGCLAAA